MKRVTYDVWVGVGGFCVYGCGVTKRESKKKDKERKRERDKGRRRDRGEKERRAAHLQFFNAAFSLSIFSPSLCASMVFDVVKLESTRWTKCLAATTGWRDWRRRGGRRRAGRAGVGLTQWRGLRVVLSPLRSPASPDAAVAKSPSPMPVVSPRAAAAKPVLPRERERVPVDKEYVAC